MDMYMSESRIMDEDAETFKTESIKPGSKSICHASAQLLLDCHEIKSRKVKAKLDSCGSVSIAHSNLLNSIRSSRSYNLPNIRLRGIGGKTNMLQKVGVLKIKRPGNESCELLCYVFDEAIGQTEEMLLISLSAIIDAKINILYHMKESNRNACKDLRFWPNNKTFEEICNDVSMEKKIHSVIQHHGRIQSRDMYLSSKEYEEVEVEHLITLVEEVYMTEIQLRRIVDRNAQEGSEQQSDGDERMVKDGENISKFSKEAMTLGDDVYAHTGKAPII